MTTRERILSIKLIDKANKNKKYANRIGLEIKSKKRKEAKNEY